MVDCISYNLVSFNNNSFDRVQSKMGVGYSFTDKLIKRTKGRNSCLIEGTMRYENDNSNNKKKSDINVRLISQVEQLIDNADLPET